MSAESLRRGREVAARNRAIAAQQNAQVGDTDVLTAPGNPITRTPIKRAKAPHVTEEDKVYSFQLVHEFPKSWKPVDKKTGQSLNSPYPPVFSIPNEGIAFDEDYIDEDGNKAPRTREWRYIEGQPSIWSDEQVGLAGMDDKKIYDLLGQEHNQIEFKDGKLNVRGIEKLKLQALMVQDAFEGKKQQYRPKIRTYRLNNPDAIIADQMSQMDKEFYAQKLAYELSTEKMLEACFVMGINIDDQTDSGLKRIKLAFLQKARYDAGNPKGLDWFTGIVSSPVTHITYVFSQAFEQGILSATQQPGKLTWAKANTPVMDITTATNIVDQLVGRYIDGEEKVLKLLTEVERQLS
jgi:hypothetical protein